jgi:hypothetical protein
VLLQLEANLIFRFGRNLGANHKFGQI